MADPIQNLTRTLMPTVKHKLKAKQDNFLDSTRKNDKMNGNFFH